MLLKVKEVNIQVREHLLGLARDRIAAGRLSLKLRELIKNAQIHINAYPLPTSRSLQEWIDDFSEHPAQGAEDNIKNYLGKVASGGLIGGKRKTHWALRYDYDKVKPSKADIGAIGEGLAGYYLEDIKKLSFEVRPLNVSPDMIFKDSAGAFHLVEVKASLDEKEPALKVAIELLTLLALTHFIRKKKYIAHIIQVWIKGTNDYQLTSLKMEVIP